MTKRGRFVTYERDGSTKVRFNALSYRKKLIEISLPLEAINDASAEEKQIKVGKPASVHNYWAPRPLAACRAMLFAQLVDDPSSCPEEFPTETSQVEERRRLHDLLATLAKWSSSHNVLLLHKARFEIARSIARSSTEALPNHYKDAEYEDDLIAWIQRNGPLIHDPFCGGGLIPLEAQRLGLRVLGSDLNPVAVMITKALVELPSINAGMKPINPDADPYRSWHGVEGLVDDVRFYARCAADIASRAVGHLYPRTSLEDGGSAEVIAWIWARTVPSPDPRAKGAHVPLISSLLLSGKKGSEVVAIPIINREQFNYTFVVNNSPSASEISAARAGTMTGSGATCLLTGTAIPFSYIRDAGKRGHLGYRLVAVVCNNPVRRGRMYVSPKESDEILARSIEVPDIPEVQRPMPAQALGFRTQEYGLDSWDKLYTKRQISAINAFADAIRELIPLIDEHCDERISSSEKDESRDITEVRRIYRSSLLAYLAFAVSRSAQTQSTLCRWVANIEKIQPCFDKQAISMTWDFGESNIFGGSTGSWSNTIKHLTNALAAWGSSITGARIAQMDAAKDVSPEPSVYSTDPPYYDNIGYADLSDYFYSWERRVLWDQFPEIYRRIETPKREELVASPGRHGGKENADRFFLCGMSSAVRNMALNSGDNVLTIYYAFKQSEGKGDMMTSSGWSSFLQAVVDAGLMIDGTWPIRSEHSSRARSQGSNALSSSIVLVCRRASENRETAVSSEFLRALRREMPATLDKIRTAGVGPTDIQQAAIGPGIGIFTRYAAVLNTDGEPMTVRDALKLVNQVREEIASEGEGDYDLDTRFAIDWFVAHGFGAGKSGDAIGMANAANLGLNDLVAAGILEAKGGTARLLRRTEMPADWDPRKDKRLTAWEGCQHLIRRLEAEDGGVDAAAQLFAILGDLTEPSHQLAFRLYDICEKKGWHAEGRPYNLLIQEWAEIENRAFALRNAPPAQGEMTV